jgi:hypothetical protein
VKVFKEGREGGKEQRTAHGMLDYSWDVGLLMGCWTTHGMLDCAWDAGLLMGKVFKKTKNPTLNLWRDDGLGTHAGLKP